MSMWKFLKTDQGKAEYIRRKKAMPDLPSNWDFHLATKNLPLERRLEFSAMAEQVLAPFIMQAMNPIPPAEEGAVGNRRTIQSPQPAI